MTNYDSDSDMCIKEDPFTGFFRVMRGERCVAIFNYCTGGEGGFFTKKQAKKLAQKFVRKMEKSIIIETKKGIKLIKRNNINDQR